MAFNRLYYFYNQKSLPPVDPEFLQKLDDAGARLAEKIARLRPEKLKLSDEAAHWLLRMQQNGGDDIRKHLTLLAWAFEPKPVSRDFVFVDHGGGFGLMSFLAREAGIPTVIHNDIFDSMCLHARIFGEALGLSADAYICGELADVVNWLHTRSDQTCLLVSINVIEHIYDIAAFFRDAASLSRQHVTLVLSTSANPLNPFVRRRHEQQHREWEHCDGPHAGFVVATEARAFYKVRLDMIRAVAPSLSDQDQARLATATRGLRKADIEKCVREFLTTRAITVAPEHPTNTCDPLTGTWEERLLDINKVEQMLKSHGFAVRVSGGYYSGRNVNPAVRTVKKCAAGMLNRLISEMGRAGARVAPSITFHATRQ